MSPTLRQILLQPRGRGLSLDAATQDWLTRVAANGGVVSGASASSIDTYIKYQKSNGLWAKTAYLLVPAGDFAASKVPLVIGTGYSAITPFNLISSDYAESGTLGGYKGNSTDKYFDTGVFPQYAGSWEVPGGFTCTGLDWDVSLQELAIGNFDNGNIVITDLSGNLKRTIVTPLGANTLQGVAKRTIDGSWWLADYAGQNLLHVTSSGTLISSFPLGWAPNGIAYDTSDDTIRVIRDTSNTIYQYNASTGSAVGTITATLAQGDGVWVNGSELIIAQDGAGNAASAILRIDKTTGSTISTVSVGMYSPEGVVIVNGQYRLASDDLYHESMARGNRIYTLDFTGINPFGDIGNFTLSAYFGGMEPGGASRVSVGATAGGVNDITSLSWSATGTKETGAIGASATTFAPSAASAAFEGYISITVNAARAQQLYKNGLAFGSPVTAVNAFAKYPLFGLAQNTAGVPSAFSSSNRRLRCIKAAASMDASEQLADYTAMQALQTALGRAV